VVGTARTDFDGFFLFERVPYGRYSVRIAAASATTAKIASSLDRNFEITPEKPIVRLGAIHVAPMAIVASAASQPAGF
jgi:hypothetical protein